MDSRPSKCSDHHGKTFTTQLSILILRPKASQIFNKVERFGEESPDSILAIDGCGILQMSASSCWVIPISFLLALIASA